MSSTALVILDEIAKALSTIKADKIRYNQHSKAIDNSKIEIKKIINEYFDYMRDQIVLTKFRGQNAREMADNLTNWESLVKYGIDLESRRLAEIYMKGVRMVAKNSIKKAIDPIGLKANEWASQYAAYGIKQITYDSRKAIQKIISESLKAGDSIQTIARKVMPMIGLNRKQAEDLIKLEHKLKTKGLKPDQIQLILDKYAKKALRHRAETIARTDTAIALIQGQV